MSTRSYIAKQLDVHTCRTTFCNSDGYLTYNGAMQLDYYSSVDRVGRLLDLGHICFLAPNTDPAAGCAHENEPINM